MDIGWVFLTKIATTCTQAATGKACVVTAAPPAAHYLGTAKLRGDGFLGIELRTDQTPAEFGFTFWHEVAHCVLHTPVRVPQGRGIDLANIDQVSHYSRAALDVVKAELLEHEREADAWAEREAARFAARYGKPIEWFALGG